VTTSCYEKVPDYTLAEEYQQLPLATSVTREDWWIWKNLYLAFASTKVISVAHFTSA
jgi:hypothetical protein